MLSKICGSADHNKNVRGSAAIVDEVIENRNVFFELKKLLSKDDDFQFIDVIPETIPAKYADLRYGITLAGSHDYWMLFSRF